MIDDEREGGWRVREQEKDRERQTEKDRKRESVRGWGVQGPKIILAWGGR